MEVSIWKNNEYYALSIKKKDRDNYFDKKNSQIKIELDNILYEINLTDSFWNNCIEIRDKNINNWIKNNNLTSWKNGHPPSLELKPIKNNTFKLIK